MLILLLVDHVTFADRVHAAGEVIEVDETFGDRLIGDGRASPSDPGPLPESLTLTNAAGSAELRREEGGTSFVGVEPVEPDPVEPEAETAPPPAPSPRPKRKR